MMSAQCLRNDEVFNKVNRFISLTSDDVSATNLLLKEVLDAMLDTMKNEDPLFKCIIGEMMFAGSFYKGTKVSKPEEFDLDLILRLPVDYNKIKIEEDRPGYAKIKLPADSYKPDWEIHKQVLNKWIANHQNYLNVDALRSWFERVVTRSFLKLEKEADGWSVLPLQSNRTVQVKTKKSGPAFTLLVVHAAGKFDVDIVPVLQFKTKPNLRVFKEIPTVDYPWYLVPKPLKIGPNSEYSWRFCFYPYEKALLSKNGKIKPVIRHMKKLKEQQNWSSIIASYYIETIVYHELKESKLNLQESSMTMLLTHMMKKLNEACKKRYIPYYWDSRCNLLDERTPEQLLPITKRMDKIIKTVEENAHQTINFFLTAVERNALTETSTSVNYEQRFELSSPTSEEPLLINFQEIPETSRSVKSMDQIAILTRTVATLSEEIKTMRSTFTDELKELKDTIQVLTEQTSAMSEIVGLLVRREMGVVSLVTRGLP